MNERAHMISWIRGEVVGPAQPVGEITEVQFINQDFNDTVAQRRGPLGWKPLSDAAVQEILYYDRESPHRKYGAGLLHPAPQTLLSSATHKDVASELALKATDTTGVDADSDDTADADGNPQIESTKPDEIASNDSDDFEVASPDVRHPSTMGITFCVLLGASGKVVVQLPQTRAFAWQPEGASPLQVNGRYESGTRNWTDDHGAPKNGPIWRRHSAVGPDTKIIFDAVELASGHPVGKNVSLPAQSPIQLRVEAFPRKIQGTNDQWIVTVVLRNTTQFHGDREPRESVLYQTLFEIAVEGGRIEKYPESRRPFEQLDQEEQSLALLYRESATWAVGHGCAAGWDADPDFAPATVFADVMPAVELPSMTPDVTDSSGNRIQLSMRSLAALSDDGTGIAWQTLENIASEYAAWITRGRNNVSSLDSRFAPVAARHLDACESCLSRINKGILLLKSDDRVRRAFRLTNLAMLLQQIATKQLEKRPLDWDSTLRIVGPKGDRCSPWDIYQEQNERRTLGTWRAFQITFLLMSLEGMRDGSAPDRDVVDLIWFPTGGGKTEAYLGVMAFYMFHERFLPQAANALRNDGTNVLMRYTLRMLTTQQFQRAASMICAMEFLRRDSSRHGQGNIPGDRFSLGLWIGGEGSPNNIENAKIELNKFRKGDVDGNPLVITECPWCRCQIGRFDGTRPRVIPQSQWNTARTCGVTVDGANGPLLHCTDRGCTFGQEQPKNWLPIEVIDDRIYDHPPSVIIATADKLAMISYKPQAGRLFGRSFIAGNSVQSSKPPGLIIQDELHLISGPLGTMYALYEGIFERLCSYQDSIGSWVKPKLIASTATIRGASDQVKSLYARQSTQLFPAPGLLMGDSFFGRYAREANGRLSKGRLYLGLHANDYGSVLTTQVRAFSSALFRPYSFSGEARDPWWTLLAFYNSIRELGGAKTLFDSDIRSRLKFMFNREGFAHDNRRNLKIVEELTSRLSQAEIVGMMDRLSTEYTTAPTDRTLDACLASNIIEVGVDIDRLSLMGVVGQPKTTATYIQVTGRVGRKWWERAGLIMMIYNPSKSRDRSHFEQFHSYHRRLYERVEPTSATPFAIAAIQRALPGALILWARQNSNASVQNYSAYEAALDSGYELLRKRCIAIQAPEDQVRSLNELLRVKEELEKKWEQNPQNWEAFPPSIAGEYLMLWPGQFATLIQKERGVVVPSSMRQVDGSAELSIHQGYASSASALTPSSTITPMVP